MISNFGTIACIAHVLNKDIGTRMISVDWQDEYESGKFHALPYELAHPVVKAVCTHIQAYRDAKKTEKDLEETEPGSSKAIKAKKATEELVDVKRYIILNRRTGWPATADWLSRHIVIEPNGKPKMKKHESKAKPWILTVRIKLKNPDAEISMQPAEGKTFRAVRCMSLTDGHLKTTFAQLIAGYGHILEEESLLRFVVFTMHFLHSM